MKKECDEIPSVLNTTGEKERESSRDVLLVLGKGVRAVGVMGSLHLLCLVYSIQVRCMVFSQRLPVRWTAVVVYSTIALTVA